MTEGAMDKVRLGRTDLMVTPVCFGTSGLGDMPDTYGYAVDEERAKATVKAIFEGPVNFIDTSRIYGIGRSEERIGAAIRERGGLPAGFVVSTKLDRDPETNRFDAPRRAARWSRASRRSGSSGSIFSICTIPSTRVRRSKPRPATARSASSSASRRKGWRRRWASRPVAWT